MDTFKVKRIDREEFDWWNVRAYSPELAAQTLIAQYESESAEYEVAAGHEVARVEVHGFGIFEVLGDPGPHYFTRKFNGRE